MKKHTHPFLNKTLIEMKDGSTFWKKWLFFRKTLLLEIDASSNNLWKKSKAIPKKKLTFQELNSKQQSNANISTISTKT